VFDPATHGLAATAREVSSILAFVSDSASLEETHRLCRSCHDDGIEFMPGLVFAGQTWIGPYAKPGRAGCWMCAILRMSPNLEPANQAALWRGLALGGEWSTKPARMYLPLSRVMGNTIAFELFKAQAEHLAPESDRAILIQELDTLECSRAAFLPHPLCPVCSSSDAGKAQHDLEAIARGSRDTNQGSERRAESPPGLLDRRAGIFRGFDDNDTVQLPLYATCLTTTATTDPPESQLRVRAVSHESLRAAREKALREGAKQYADHAPDRRRMPQASIQQLLERGTSFRAAEELSSWTGGPCYEPHEVIDWLPAYSWPRREVLLVPAAGVYPLTSLNQKGVFEAGSSGIGIGATFEEASSDGICSALCYERICETVRNTTALLALKLDRLAALDPHCAYLKRVLSRYPETIRLYELAHEGPVRVVVAEASSGDSGSEPVSRIGSGLSRIEAAGTALLELAGAFQSMESGESSISPNLPLPAFRLPIDIQLSDLDSSLYAESAAHPTAVLSNLMDNRRDTLFCDITPADLQGVFLIGRVLLTTAEPARGFRSDSEEQKDTAKPSLDC
jgi:bacteriocin biosynthesis cyclodehydratase domain-containing protein